MADPSLDPLERSTLPAHNRAEELVHLADENEMLVAKSSLDATLRHWQDGRQITAHDWIQELYAEVSDFAKQRGFACFLSPVKKILREGNTAQQWLRMYEQTNDAQAVIMQAIAQVEQQEIELDNYICQAAI